MAALADARAAADPDEGSEQADEDKEEPKTLLQRLRAAKVRAVREPMRLWLERGLHAGSGGGVCVSDADRCEAAARR